ncbi:MAG: hypothetical protein PVF58_04485 [Candidatus Methanofastidiosia archaeon]
MDKKLMYVNIVTGVITFLMFIITSSHIYWIFLVGFVTSINIFSNYIQQKRMKSYLKIGKEQFLLSFGVEPDKVKIITRPLSTYDKKTMGISGKAAQIKFWSNEKIYKAIIDFEYRFLHMKGPVFYPVYNGEDILLWKETPVAHKNGTPKKVEFYDGTELLHRVDYRDSKGNLVKDSWRRHHGTVEFWDPKKQIWVPIP